MERGRNEDYDPQDSEAEDEEPEDEENDKSPGLRLKGGKGKGAVLGKGTVLDDDDYFAMMAAAAGVESMNNANKEVRAQSAVAPVNSMMLLLRKESTRYNKACNDVNKGTTSLTPKGE